MKKIIYIDCFSGISGDMMMGALLDLGIDVLFLKKELGKLGVSGYSLELKEIKAGSIRAKKFDVKVTGEQPDRGFKDIRKIINESKLGDNVKKISMDIFRRIGEAEAVVHGCNINEVHFHEVGALDSIIDITGTAICLNKLKISSFHSSKIPLGKGFVSSSHGKLPVPAPATVEILKEVPVYGGNFDFEVTTPTGAAVIKTLSGEFGSIPCMKIEKIGYGAGNNKGREIPNILRLLKGDTDSDYGLREETIIMLSANIDDSTPEIIGYLMEKLFKKGALDAWVEPIYMKKNRPAFKVNALCGEESEKDMANIMLLESTTLGVRREKIKRYSAERKLKTIRLPYGEVRLKVGTLRGKKINVSPEFESCKKLAEKTGKPLKEIYRDAILFFSRR